MTVEASDPDAGANGTISYQIRNAPSNLKKISTITSQLPFHQRLSCYQLNQW